jgi:hypothetical protein
VVQQRLRKREQCKLTVVSNSIWMARTAPSLLSSLPPPLVKKAKFHREAIYGMSVWCETRRRQDTHRVRSHALDSVDEHSIALGVDDLSIKDDRSGGVHDRVESTAG